MRLFQIERSNSDLSISHPGLALVGLAINKHTSLGKALRKIPKRHGIANIDLIRAYVGQLSLGKNDFDAIEDIRDDPYFRSALGIGQIPSSSRLRQRFDEDARAMIPLIHDATAAFIKNSKAPISPISTGHIPLDVVVYPMDNSQTKKEGVSRTDKGYDGYAPTAAYLGLEGWAIGVELREGSWHSQKEFGHVLERVLSRARELVGLNREVLLRIDSAHDSEENRERLAQEERVDFLIKWNPRQQRPEEWLEDVKKWANKKGRKVEWEQLREGKRVALFSERIEEQYTTGPKAGETYTVRRVIHMMERTIDKKGQCLLIPDVTLEGWWTTLDEENHPNQRIIDLYKDHATSWQYHSEFKTVLDLERFPSGKFDTNDLVLTLGAFGYNILRWIGLMGLTGGKARINAQGMPSTP